MRPDHDIVLSLQLADPHRPAVVVVDGNVVEPHDAGARAAAEDLVYLAVTDERSREKYVVRELPVVEAEQTQGREARLTIAAVVAAGTPEATLRRSLTRVCAEGHVVVDDSEVRLLSEAVAGALLFAHPRPGLLARAWRWLRSLMRRSR